MAANLEALQTAMHPPEAGWDGRLPKAKRNWWIVFWVYSLGIALFSAAWFWIAPNHEIPQLNQPISPEAFHAEVVEFAKKYETAPGSGIVAPPPGGEAFLEGGMWNWYPTLKLKAGQTYTIWLSSKDVTHSLIIGEQHLVFDAIPGHKYGIRLTPDKPGTYLIYCAEFCGLGHQNMGGRIIVE